MKILKSLLTLSAILCNPVKKTDDPVDYENQ